MVVTKEKVKLTFPENLVKEPIITQFIRQFEVVVNVRRASVEENLGWIICELDAEQEQLEQGVQWLKDLGVGVDRLGDVVEG